MNIAWCFCLEIVSHIQLFVISFTPTKSIFVVCFYISYPILNYFNLQTLFIYHVHRQSLVTCYAFPDIVLFEMAWIVNIVVIDISVIIVVL